MNEYFEKIIGWLLGGVMVLIGLIWKYNDARHRSSNRRIEQLADQIRNVETYAVTRDTIVKLESDWRDELNALREERRENHKENGRRLDKIDESLQGVIEMAIVVRDVKTEIGDHRSGLRGQMHEQRKNLVRLAGKVPGGLDVIE